VLSGFSWQVFSFQETTGNLPAGTVFASANFVSRYGLASFCQSREHPGNSRNNRKDPTMAVGSGDGLAMKVYCYFQGQLAVNVWYYVVTNVAGVCPNINLITLAFDAIAAPLYKAVLTNGASYRGTAGQKISSVAVGYAIEGLYQTSANSGIGSGGTTALPTQVSGIITKRTNIAGRTGRGRVYIPFPDESFVTGTTGAPTAAYITALNLLATNLFFGVTAGSGGNTCVLSASLMREAPATTVSWPGITSYVSQAKFATQKRRGQYGRLNILPF
jgi:hypothetical protein